MEVQKKDQAAPADQGVKSDSQAPENIVVDYKAELALSLEREKKASEERDNYKKGMLNAKDQLKQSKKKDDDEVIDDDTLDIKSQVESLVKEGLSTIQKDLSLNAFDTLIAEYTSNLDEQALIRFHFENSVAPIGSIRDRIENAQLIANKKALLKEHTELKRALESRNGISHDSAASGANQDAEKGKKDFFTSEQLAYFKKRGLDPEKVKENILKMQSR